MMQTDEETTIIKVNRHRSILEKYTQQFKGRILQYYGDASLTIYDSAIDAVQCAIAMQAAYQQVPKVPLRIGIHLGEVVFDKDDIYGDAINIANRIESIGISNSILLSGKVQEELKNHPELLSKKIGDYNFKNINTLIPVYALDLQGLAIPKVNTNSSKAFSKPQKKLIQKIGIPLLSICLSLLATVAAFKPQWLSLIKSKVSSVPVNEAVTEKRIAVLNFENGTGLKEMDILSRVSSDWITQGLMETGKAKIITTRAIEQHFDYQQASTNPTQAITSFTKKTGAQSTIEGSFFIQKDSIFFLAKIINLHSGEILLSFPPQKSHKDQPLVALEKIKQRICGYWIIKEDKNLLTLTPPIYDAYKKYLLAKEFWSNDYSKALKHLDRSIALDSNFLLANFLKISLLQNTKKIDEAKNLVSKIKKTHPRLNPHYRNALSFYELELYGDNQKALEAFKKIYNVYKEDIFGNTSMAVMYLDYKNNPKKTLEILAEVDPKNIDYENCSYLSLIHI